jgi:hypothetical protein
MLLCLELFGQALVYLTCTRLDSDATVPFLPGNTFVDPKVRTSPTPAVVVCLRAASPISTTVVCVPFDKVELKELSMCDVNRR